MKRLSLSHKFLIEFLAFALLLGALLGYQGYREITDEYTLFYATKAKAAANMAVSILDSEALVRYHETLQKDDAYEQTQLLLNKIKQAEDIRYLYVFYPSDDGYLYLFDARSTRDDDGAELSDLGDVDAYPMGNVNMMRVFTTGVGTESLIVTNTELGYVGTIFEAVQDASGHSVALVGADVSMSRMERERSRFILQNSLWVAAIVIVMVGIYLAFLQRSLVRPLHLLTQSVSSYVGAGDRLVYEPVEIHTGDEVEQLGDAFDKMAKDLRGYIEHLQSVTAEKQRIATELDVAHDIQMSMLPRVFPPFPECSDFSIYAELRTAKEVGGDFYDFFRLKDGRFCFLVADVSGKGVPAALFMMIAKALIKNAILEGADPAKAFAAVNQRLAEGNERCMFVTAYLAVLDIEAQTLTTVNAGHNPPLLARAGEPYAYIHPRRSPPLAAVEGVSYAEESMDFRRGDRFFLYTDGVNEALNAQIEQFGEQRLLDSLNSHVGHDAPELAIERVRVALDAFVQDAPQADDITMVAVELKELGE